MRNAMPQSLHVTEVYAPNFIIDTSLNGSAGLVIKPNKFDEMIPILGFAPHRRRGDTGHRAANFPGPLTTLHFLFARGLASHQLVRGGELCPMSTVSGGNIN